MSGGIAPSKSTVYVSNLPFSLTNNDLHKIFAKFGRVVKVTIVKDKITRKNKGVAFVLFMTRDDANKCCRSLNNTQMFGRTLKCSIAQDNGRTTEFIRRKEYKDKSMCYECGEEGHLSYECPHNLLGDRERPEKRKRKRKYQEQYAEEYGDSDSDEEKRLKQENEDPTLDSLAAAISYQAEKEEEEDYRIKVATGDYGPSTSQTEQVAKKYSKDTYFSDEEEID